MKTVLIWFVTAFIFMEVSANNIQIDNVSLTGQNTIAGVNNPNNFVFVQFTISWENSWRSSTGPSNWDAAWVFVKYRMNGGIWQHASLNNSGHTAPSGSIINTGLLNPGLAFHLANNPGIGAFIYRNTNGSGLFTAINAQLRWNFGVQSIPDNSSVEIKVFAVEMVYIPQGDFNVGGGGGTNAFTSTTINTANATVAPSGSGSLGGQAGGYPTGQTAPSSISWPNGFAASYCMKYEISQKQYVDFLNTITRTQQSNLVATVITGTTITNRFVMSNTTTTNGRNSIRCDATIPSSPTPVTFYNDLNGNSLAEESSDGQWIACSWLSWADLTAYLDWIGLRPMTELEFEKICRGNLFPVSGEYAWGNTAVTGATGISNSGEVSEVANNAGANAIYNNSASVQGPMRVGCLAGATTGRTASGAGYYGAMELSGSLYERPVNIGSIQGRAFTGLHGDGAISAAGVANVSNWPDASALGTGFRGGMYLDVETVMQVSNRSYANVAVNSRVNNYGGRGVRTAP